MNIMCISGSHRGKNHFSHSRKIIELLCERVESKVEEPIAFETVDLVDCDIAQCKGCCLCFRRDACRITDDYNSIENKMYQADVIIMGSPTYAGTVSSAMKMFLERCSSMMHRRGLSGKLGITVVTCVSAELGERTAYYLSNMMRHMGIGIADVIECDSIMMPSPKNEMCNDMLETAAVKLVDAYINNPDMYSEPDFGLNFEMESQAWPSEIKKLFKRDMEAIKNK